MEAILYSRVEIEGFWAFTVSCSEKIIILPNSVWKRPSTIGSAVINHFGRRLKHTSWRVAIIDDIQDGSRAILANYEQTGIGVERLVWFVIDLEWYTRAKNAIRTEITTIVYRLAGVL